MSPSFSATHHQQYFRPPSTHNPYDDQLNEPMEYEVALPQHMVTPNVHHQQQSIPGSVSSSAKKNFVIQNPHLRPRQTPLSNTPKTKTEQIQRYDKAFNIKHATGWNKRNFSCSNKSII